MFAQSASATLPAFLAMSLYRRFHQLCRKTVRTPVKKYILMLCAVAVQEMSAYEAFYLV